MSISRLRSPNSIIVLCGNGDRLITGQPWKLLTKLTGSGVPEILRREAFSRGLRESLRFLMPTQPCPNSFCKCFPAQSARLVNMECELEAPQDQVLSDTGDDSHLIFGALLRHA